MSRRQLIAVQSKALLGSTTVHSNPRRRSKPRRYTTRLHINSDHRYTPLGSRPGHRIPHHFKATLAAFSLHAITSHIRSRASHRCVSHLESITIRSTPRRHFNARHWHSRPRHAASRIHIIALHDKT